MADRENAENGIFTQLAVVAGMLALASVLAWLLSFGSPLYSRAPGVPSDYAVATSFAAALGTSQCVTIFLPTGGLGILVARRFWIALLRSLPYAAGVWLVVAGLGSRLALATLLGEPEWVQIALVLSSACVTLLLWHVYTFSLPAAAPAAPETAPPPPSDP